MVKDKAIKLLKTKQFIDRHCYNSDTVNYGDCYLQQCKFCGESSWKIKDIKHKKTCEVGVVLEELRVASCNTKAEKNT